MKSLEFQILYTNHPYLKSLNLIGYYHFFKSYLKDKFLVIPYSILYVIKNI